ncbi:hypothetical protein M0R45_005965 [Rubus argutus]|uniref:RRM domain-containing protein n=1 Tax=Rubus argutus TaxID=59490 RepID=A0AAW1YP43_RUBAR
MRGETHTRDYVGTDVNGNGPVDNYGFALLSIRLTSVPLASDWNDFSQSIASSNAIERPVAGQQMKGCYAFIEFEEISGVRNAVKAGSVKIAGQQLYIE